LNHDSFRHLQLNLLGHGTIQAQSQPGATGYDWAWLIWWFNLWRPILLTYISARLLCHLLKLGFICVITKYEGGGSEPGWESSHHHS